MASDIVNSLTRNLLSEITNKELLEKVLEQKESNGKNVAILSKSFENSVKNVLISQYNLEPPYSDKLDLFAESFRKTVRRHADSLKKLKFSNAKKVQQILENNNTFYGIKIKKTELVIRRRRKRKSGTSRPENPENLQTPLEKRIRRQESFRYCL